MSGSRREKIEAARAKYSPSAILSSSVTLKLTKWWPEPNLPWRPTSCCSFPITTKRLAFPHS